MDQLIEHALTLASQPATPLIAPIKNRIAYVVSHGQSYASNGYAIRTQGVAKALNEHGFDTLCFVRPGRPWELGTTVQAESTVDGVRYIHSHWNTSPPINEKAHLEQSVQRFIELFSVYRPAVVLAASNYIVALPAWIAAKRLGLPFNYEVRGFWELSREAREPGYNKTKPYLRELFNEIFITQQAINVITINNEMKDELITRGVEKERISIIANSVPKASMITTKKVSRSDLGIKEEEKVIGYIGSFSNYEGINTLKKACAELISEGYPVKLLLVGDESNPGTKKNDWTINIGRIRPDEVNCYYKMIDTIVIPRVDSKVTRLVTPLKLVEALSYNKSVLVADQVPTSQYVNLNNIFKFKSGDIDDLKKNVLESFTIRHFPTNRNILTFESEVSKIIDFISNTLDDRNIKDTIHLAKASFEYYINGSAGTVKYLSNKNTLTKRCFIEASNFFKSHNLLHTAKDILNSYLKENNEDTASLKALFWLKKKEMDFETCHKIVNKLEKNKYITKSEIDKLRRSYGCYSFLKLFDSLENNQTPKIKSNKSRICYLLHNSLPYSSGGYATRADGVAQGLQACGYDVIIVTRPGFPIDIKPELRDAKFNLEEEISGVNYKRILSPDRKTSSGVDYIEKASVELLKKFKELRPEVVIAASNHITAIPALIAARKLGITFIYEVRGFWEVTRVSREPEYARTSNYHLMTLYEGLTARHADHVLTLTEPMREELITRGVEASKISLMPNSCDPSRFTPRTRDPMLSKKFNIPDDITVIGYIGSFVIYEGLEHLAAACGLLKKQGVKFRLLIVGNENTSGNDRGPITKEIQDIAEECGFSDWLIMPGRVPHEEVESYYSLIDIAPFPRKPWPVCEMVSPMKPLEAMAMEKAVVVSSVRALVEMVREDETGLVFNKGSIESLAEQLAKLISEPELRKKLGKSGRAWVEQKRTWHSTGGVATSIIKKILQSKNYE